MQFVKDIDFDTIIPFEEQFTSFAKYLKDFGDSKAPSYCVANSKDFSKVYYPLVTGVDLLGFIEFDFAEHLIIHTKKLWQLLESVNLSKDIYVLVEDVLAKYYSWAEVGRKPVCFDVNLSSKDDWMTCKNINDVSKDWTIKAVKYAILKNADCSLNRVYNKSIALTNKTVLVVDSSKITDTFPVLFLKVLTINNPEDDELRDFFKNFDIDILDESYLAFRIVGNAVNYLSVFKDDYKLITELLNIEECNIKEVSK